jgi:hypothetical protein
MSEHSMLVDGSAISAANSAWIHRSISELDEISAGQQGHLSGMALHLMGEGPKGRERASDQRKRVIS